MGSMKVGNIIIMHKYNFSHCWLVILSVILGTILITSSAGFVAPFLTSGQKAQSNDTPAGQANPEPVPESSSGSPSPEPMTWSGREFIISYDDSGLNDALNPSIMVTPPGNAYANSIHAVWNELNETAGVQTIHYSMSLPGQRGLNWSNDEPSEGDRTINGIYGGKNATSPSIAIDNNGFIHMVWCQEYPGTPPSYEVHFSRSTNNGQTWSPEVPISFRKGGGMDTPEPIFPKIAISNNYQGHKILHVVWSEFDPTGGLKEVFYSKSDNGGAWSGAGQDMPISSTGSMEHAFDPDIAVGGSNSELVHVVWTQFNPAGMVNEVFYTRSVDAGGSMWELERTISNPSGASDLWIGKAKMSAIGQNVITIWDQPLITGGESEICLSMSTEGGAGDWTGENTDTRISHPDAWGADMGSGDIIAGLDGSTHAIWTEIDENSPYGSSEIHYSMSLTPQIPDSWTGREMDIVLSYPDGENNLPANATNPVLSLANFGDGLKPQIFWSELNADESGKAQHNNEIHYIPQTTFNIPVHLGWNLISVPLIQSNTNILTVFNDNWGDGLTTWDIAQGFDRSATPSWTSYSKYKPSSLHTLLNVNQLMGVWIKITALGDGYLTVYGDYGTSTIIQLKAGWNLVGYPAQTSKSVTDSFSGVSQFLSCEGYSASDAYRLTTLAGSYMMKPGEGYWVQVSADTTWTVNW
jgi:hypothetical protein